MDEASHSLDRRLSEVEIHHVDLAARPSSGATLRVTGAVAAPGLPAWR